MDVQREISPRKKWIRKYAWGLAIPVVLSLGTSVHLAFDENRVQIEASSLIIGTVKKSSFREQITCDGIARPYKSVLIDALLSGKIVRRYALNGQHLEKGDTILELQNTDLELDILNKETQVHELITNIQFTANQIEQNRVNRLSELTDALYQLKEAERLYKLNLELVEDSVISLAEWQEVENKRDYLQQRSALIQKAVVSDSLSGIAQMVQMKTSLEQAQKNLELMRIKLADLNVVAPISGQLSAFKLEDGELVNVGENIGQMDVLDSFIIRAQVDEHFLNRVAIGQTAILELNGVAYSLEVQYVNPSVENNFFSIDLEFKTTDQPELKRGQNLRVQLHLGTENLSLILPKGSFYQSTGGQWVFVVNSNGEATKQEVKIGRQNEEYYEIISGLEAGEQVIISSYAQFKDYDKIEIL